MVTLYHNMVKSTQHILVIGAGDHMGCEGVQPVHGGHEPLHRHAAPPQLRRLRRQLAVRPARVRRGRTLDGGRRGDLVVLCLQVSGDAGTLRHKSK